MNLHLNTKQPHRLTVEQIANPRLALHEFFHYYSPADVRNELWELLKAALTSAQHQQEPGERSGLLHFYEMLDKAVEAAYILHTRGDRRSRRRNRRRKGFVRVSSGFNPDQKRSQAL